MSVAGTLQASAIKGWRPDSPSLSRWLRPRTVSPFCLSGMQSIPKRMAADVSEMTPKICMVHVSRSAHLSNRQEQKFLRDAGQAFHHTRVADGMLAQPRVAERDVCLWQVDVCEREMCHEHKISQREGDPRNIARGSSFGH